MDSYSLRDETNLKERISQDNSIYTHYLLTVIEKLKDELEEALEFYRKSSMEEFIEKKEKMISGLIKSKDISVTALREHELKVSEVLEELSEKIEFYPSRLEALKMKITLNSNEDKVDENVSSHYLEENRLLDEVWIYILGNITKEDLKLRTANIKSNIDIEELLLKLEEKSRNPSIQLSRLKKMIEDNYFKQKKDLKDRKTNSEKALKDVNWEINLLTYNQNYMLEKVKDLKLEKEAFSSKSSSHHRRIEELEDIIAKNKSEIEHRAMHNYTLNPDSIKQENRLRRLNLICEEKKNYWEEELNNRKKIIDTRNINMLFHFTGLNNIDSIFQHGLLSREMIERKEVNASPSDMSGMRQLSEFISISITYPNYKMFYSKRQAEKNKKWVIFSYNPQIIYSQPCYFSPSNASNKNYNFESYGLEDLFNLEEIREENKLENSYTTDPQAEVLFYKFIDNESILSVYCEDNNMKNHLSRIYPTYSHLFKVNVDLFKPRKDYSFWSEKRDYYSIKSGNTDG
jgi:hypothetical protein